ncbi:PVC-type heme-binding CxxCH protein [Fimbriiglobus ruber]|uniref:Cytochrome c domain-containing protein n=1 Tax=Fimbriiglobus ruber TaxID=1908690 RepID=A0A225DQW3_9BACT|nr:PVC-type heme-binding CxxCH protein [Fimbriiglobus ruber]OWK43782.1 hypothetical protein FRUB_03381 [Fimbriiglobus ruber]
MMRHTLPVLLGLLAFAPASAWGQGFSPEDAVRRMKLPDGFTARAVATEPMIRQPLSISFDERGRMWVLQYLQYPNPAGLKPVKQDQYLRTVWDRIPEPPPRGPKGADRITICYDPDEHGVYHKSKDFVSGLNLATGFCIGGGGVYVVQPPYLLFYPDKDHDDVPDGDPEVVASGFGMEDTHSYANSLQWGPDGWLYGAHGSTVSAKIKNPARPNDPPLEFQQGVWRYHPKTKEFELFSEGGGNTYGLDFDKNGQVIAGTNYGGFAMLHQVQGAYYVKGFSKHGPLHNPHTYGYFEHVPYKDFKGGHVTCGGVVYQADAYPEQYRDQYIAGNLLSNAIYWHKLEPNGSTFTARHGGDLLVANDTWFRPVDCFLGPDGSVHVADWYDKRAAHLDPIDTWDKTNGRIYKIEYQGTKQPAPFDLRKLTSRELVDLLKHPNKWWRTEARRLLAERQDAATYPDLKSLIENDKGVIALEAIWALYVSGGWTDDYALAHLPDHPNPHARAWFVRLLGDHQAADVSTQIAARLGRMAAEDKSPVVLAQLACTTKRLPTAAAREILTPLLRRADVDADPFVPLLVWWALESKIDSDPAIVSDLVWSADHRDAVLKQLERYVRRTLSDNRPGSEAAFWRLVGTMKEAGVKPAWAALLRGTEAAMDAGTGVSPQELAKLLAWLRSEGAVDSDAALRVLARLGDDIALKEVRARILDEKRPEADRLKWTAVVTRAKGDEFPSLFVDLLAAARTDTMRAGLLTAVAAGNHPKAVDTLFQLYPSWSPAMKSKAVGVLLSRPTWAQALLAAIDAGKFPKTAVSYDQLKTGAGLTEPAVAKLVEKHYGKIGPATPGEKQARISWLGVILGREGPGDAARGKAVFTKNCATCHTLFGEGGKVGPDLTTADRKNRGYMLTQIIDPSGYIRPEFVTYKVDTVDGRALTGIVAETASGAVTLLNVVDNKPVKTVVAQTDIDKMAASPVSLMPEKLLDTMTDAEIRDLFAFLTADVTKTSAPQPAAKPAAGANAAGGKKLKLCLVSGSLEYKSDETLAAFQTYLEANYPVECVRAFRKTDTDLPGLDQLETCDAAIFFTRRLTIDGEQLERVKKYAASGKPVIGIRTASHGFQKWLEMDALVYGGNYKNHYGQNLMCEVKLAETGKDHPVLKGVKPFTTSGGLYKNTGVAKDVTVLLTGTIPEHAEPVAWVREREVNGVKQRVFYTSLGHPDDFKNPNFTRLLVNGLAWATKSEWPAANH